MIVRTIADIEAREATPIAAMDYPASVYAMLRSQAARHAHAPALIYIADAATPEVAETLTYGAFFGEINRAANLFHANGLRPDHALALLLPLVPEAHIALWGAEAAGIASPINPMLDAGHVAALLVAADARGVVVWADEADNAGIWDTLLTALALGTPVATVYGVGQFDASIRAGQLPAGVRFIDFDRARCSHRADGLDSERSIGPDEIAAYFHTGGTTGTPKLAMHTHFNQAVNGAIQASLAADEHGLPFLCGLPMFHVNAAIVTGVTAFAHANPVVLATPWGFRPPEVRRQFWRLVAHWRIAVTSLVPTLVAALLDQPIDADVTSLRTIFSGGAALPAEVLARFEAATGVTILEGYGLTEATCCCTCNPRDGVRKPGSVGLRSPYESVRIAQVDGLCWQRDCAPGEAGRLLLRGPNIFAGYRDPVHDAAAWVTIDGERWLDSGDLAYLDDDQFVWLTGRSKDLIIRGGHNIEPRVIEEAMNRHPSVSECAAVGRIDAYAGEVPVAYVTLRPGRMATAKELADHAARMIGERAAVPKFIRIVDALPLTTVGKAFKPTLREWEAVSAVSDALATVLGDRLPDVTAATEQNRGLVVTVALADPSDEAVAMPVLRRFPIPANIVPV